MDIQKFANNTSPEITSFIVQKSIELYTNGVNLKRLLPTFLKLASSPNEDVRNLIFNLFQRAYKKDPEEFIFFLDLIFKLTRDQNIKVRLDATNHLFKILFTTPQELLEKWSSKMDVYFKHFKNLAHDDNPDIRLIISNYLKELILVFPGRAKDILRILYIFIRSGENQVMESTSIAVKILLKNQPELKKKVSSDLKRFYTRSHDGMLLTLMNEVK